MRLLDLYAAYFRSGTPFWKIVEASDSVSMALRPLGVGHDLVNF